jgi:hypothetical protein
MANPIIPGVPTKTPAQGKVVAPVRTPAAPPAATPPLTTAQQSASDLLKQTLIEWGLSSLLPHLQEYLTKGYDSTTVNLYLQDTAEWKARFAGNEIRKANGLAVLSPAQYIANEEQYRNILQGYGLPPGFYDSHDDFNKFIGNDVSPAEVQSRAQIAHDTYFAAPEQMRQLWASYGFSHGDGIASILDPNVGTQIIQDRATQVQIGATAAQNGFQLNQARAQQFQQHGTTLAKAQAAYGQIAQSYGTDQNIASRFGQQFGQTQEENDVLLGDGKAALQRQNLYSDEKGLFDGRGGATAQSLAVSQDH